MNGKGSKQRPRQVSRRQFEDNWDAVFVTDCCGRSRKQCRCDRGPTHVVEVSDTMMPFWPVRRIKRQESPGNTG